MVRTPASLRFRPPDRGIAGRHLPIYSNAPVIFLTSSPAFFSACVASIAAIWLSGACPASAQGTVTFESLLSEMVDLEAVARFPSPQYEAKQASTYNRLSTARDQADQGTGGWFADSDGLGYIRTEQRDGQTEWVVMEHSGPGAITRFWTPFFYKDFGNRTGPKVRIYLDGATTPVIDQNLIELLTNLNWSTAEYGSKPSPQNSVSLPAPFSNFTARAGVLHFPIPFAQSCKVTLSGGPFYDIISYRAYPPGTSVETFTAAKFQSPLLATVGAALTNPPASSDPQIQQSGTVAANQGELALDLPAGARAVTELEIDLDEAAVAANPALLRNLVLSATFDGTETVWCPVGDFFNSADRANNVATLARVSTATDGKFVCRWRMPYQTGGRVRLLNCGTASASAVLKIRTASWQWDARSMHFHARWRPDFISPGTPFHDWNFVDVAGKGVLVGDVWTVLNLTNGWWGEGDEKIYVDDEYAVAKFPGNFGTGTEDYYGWAGGVVPTRTDEFATPFEANAQVGSTAANSPKGFNICTRTRMLDAMPFNSRLVFDMEASPGTDQRNSWNLLMYSAATFYYAIPGSTHNRPALPARAAQSITSLESLQAESDRIRNGGGSISLPNAVEAEALAPATASPGIATTVETPALGEDPDHLVSAGSYRNLPFTAAGQFVEFRLTEQFNPRMLALYLTTMPGAGKADVWVNGRKVAGGVDASSPTLGRKVLKLGYVKPVDPAFAVRVVAAAGSTGHAVALDAFTAAEPKPISSGERRWRLGEDDPGAVANASAGDGTRDGSGNLTLAASGTVTYRPDSAVAGGTLSIEFGGAGHLTAQGAPLYDGIDLSDFELAFRAKPTGGTSFHVPVALGRYGSGSCFVYHAGGSWRFHINGTGDVIIGPANSVKMNQWQQVRLIRRNGATRLEVDGVELGTTAAFVTPSADLTFGAAKNGSGNPDGRFIGLLDEIVFTSGTAGYAAFVRTRLPQAAPAETQPAADPDGDGAANALEYLLGTDPASAASVPVARISADAAYSPPMFRFLLDDDARSVLYWEIETSADLVNWAVAARQPLFDGPLGEAVAVEAGPGLEQRGFARLVLPENGIAAQ